VHNALTVSDKQPENEMEIQVKAKSVYGATLFYPANTAACHLAAIAGSKTLTLTVLRHAKDMGATVLIDGEQTLRDLLAAA
jgi:hypothetical protein